MTEPESLISRLPTPLVLFGALLSIISMIELLVHFLTPHMVPDTHHYLQSVVDSLLLSVLSAPFIWLLIARPMRIAALAEFTRAKMVLESIAEAVIQFDGDGTIKALNPVAERIFGHERRQIIGEHITCIVPGLEVGAGALPGAGEPGKNVPASWETSGRRMDGSSFPVEISISRLSLERRPTFIAIVHDCTERKRVEALMVEQKEFAESLVQNSAVPTFVLNAEHRVLFWNRACEELTGVKGEAMLGTDEHWKPFYEDRRSVLADMVIEGITEQVPKQYRGIGSSDFIPGGLQAEGWYHLCGMNRYIFFNAAPICNGRGELIAVIETLEDITDRKQYEEQLEYQANHDGLTNLPNRNLLADRMQQCLLASRRSGRHMAVFFVDLDHFKFINDSLGHDVGDNLLQLVAERMVGCVRSEDTVARQGGDEFVIVVAGLEEPEHAARIASTIQERLAMPFKIHEHELVITCSIGISVSPRDGKDVQTLLKNADLALYRAKEQGRDGFRFYTAEMNDRTLTRMSMEKHLRRALEREELLLHYQPKVSLLSGRITGMEALIRWQHPEMGMIPPDQFIPLAEEIGLIEPMGEWVVRTACAQNRAWQDAGLPPLTMAVNLSARQFRQQDVGSVVRRALEDAGLSPRYLELEITESLVMQNVERVTSILEELKSMGVWLTMDDFGTGYSSLSYLRRFPFDNLKIDQSFVRDLTSDLDSAAIAKAIIAMAHSLNLKVIAEGVETEGQLTYLRSQHCDEMQGYYFSRPVPAAAFEELLREGVRLQIPSGAVSCSQRTVLVVDDDQEVAASLKRTLTLDGYHVLTALCGAEGFELLATHRVSVVICDQRMPGMNGSEFLRRVKELYPHTTRILLSGHADLDSISEAVNQGGVFKFLAKPWDDDVVREKVGEAFRFHESLIG